MVNTAIRGLVSRVKVGGGGISNLGPASLYGRLVCQQLLRVFPLMGAVEEEHPARGVEGWSWLFVCFSFKDTWICTESGDEKNICKSKCEF